MFDVRACADQDEYSRAIGAIGQYFNPPPSEDFLERFTETLPHERMHAAFEGDQLVGGAGAFPFELSVPGGSLPCAGITAVGVVYCVWNFFLRFPKDAPAAPAASDEPPKQP